MIDISADVLLDVYRELTGSRTYGSYGVTLIDALWDSLTDVESSLMPNGGDPTQLASAQGFILNGSTAGGPQPSTSDVPGMIHSQLLGGPTGTPRWGPTTDYSRTHWDGRYRTLRELVLQLRYFEMRVVRPKDVPLDPRDPQAPTLRPANLTATVEASTGKIFLNWDDVPGATAYQIYEDQSPNGVPNGRVTKSESLRGPLGPGNYHYWVTAIFGATESEPTAKVLAAVTALPSGSTGRTLPDGTAQGTLEWRCDLGRTLISSGNYKSTSWNAEPQSAGWPPRVVNTSPIGRGIAFTLQDRWKRQEVEPDIRSFGGSGEEWFAFTFGVDGRFPLSTSSWQVIWQLHGNDTTSPRFALQLNRNKLSIGDARGLCSIAANTRYDVVTKADFGRGLMSVWVNGTKVADNVGVGKSATPYYLKVGFYHDPSLGGGTIWQSNHALGSGYGAVDPTGR